MDIKVIFFINSTGFSNSGWSETYWVQGASLAAVTEEVKDGAKLRSRALCANTPIVAIRLSNAAVRGDSRVMYSPRTGFGAPLGIQCDAPWESILWRFQNGDTYRALHHFRGIDAKADQPKQKEGIDWRKLLLRFSEFMIKHKWCLRATLGGLDAPLVPIQNLIFDADNSTLTVTTSGAHGLLAGDEAKISRAKTTSGSINGRYQVHAVNNDTEYTVGYLGPADNLYLGSGLSQKKAIGLLPIDKGQFVRFSHKKVGRPFGLRPGRAARRAGQ